MVADQCDVAAGQRREEDEREREAAAERYEGSGAPVVPLPERRALR